MCLCPVYCFKKNKISIYVLRENDKLSTISFQGWKSQISQEILAGLYHSKISSRDAFMGNLFQLKHKIKSVSPKVLMKGTLGKKNSLLTVWLQNCHLFFWVSFYEKTFCTLFFSAEVLE